MTARAPLLAALAAAVALAFGGAAALPTPAAHADAIEDAIGPAPLGTPDDGKPDRRPAPLKPTAPKPSTPKPTIPKPTAPKPSTPTPAAPKPATPAPDAPPPAAQPAPQPDAPPATTQPTPDDSSLPLTPDPSLGEPPVDAEDLEPPEPDSTDVFDQLGGGSPWCDDQKVELSKATRANCDHPGGSLATAYPTDNYGIDTNVDIKMTSPKTWIMGMLQWLISAVWTALLYVVKCVLALLERALATDIYDLSRDQTADAVKTLNGIIGTPFLPVALAVAGLIGVWNGVIRRRSIETLGALATTVVLMVCGLVIIERPNETVGHLSDLSNQAALGALSAASAGTVESPTASFADALAKLHDTMLLGAWSALMFGDPKYATTENAKGHSIADAYLAFPADSAPRKLLYKQMKGKTDSSWKDDLRGAVGGAVSSLTGSGGDDDLSGDKLKAVREEVAANGGNIVTRSPEHVALQEANGTIKRFGVLVLVVIGVSGGVALIGSIAIRLVIEGALMVMVLVLLTPVAMHASAYGEPGKRAFLGWARKLLAALAAKVIYSVLLAVVLLVSGVLMSLQDALGGWLPCWVVVSAFWWALFLNRQALFAMTAVGQSRGGGLLSTAYHASQVAGGLRRGARSVTRRPLRIASWPVRAGTRPVRRRAHRTWDNARAAAIPALREWVSEARNEHVRRLEEREQATQPTTEVRQRASAGRDRSDPMNRKDVRHWTAQRELELEQRPWHDAANLRAAGIDPAAYRAAAHRPASDEAAQKEVNQFKKRAKKQMREDRELLDGARGERARARATRRSYAREERGDNRARLKSAATVASASTPEGAAAAGTRWARREWRQRRGRGPEDDD